MALDLAPHTPVWQQIKAARMKPGAVLRYFDLLSAPVRIYDLARLLGAELYDYSGWTMDISGQVTYDGRSAPRIFLNEHHAEVRKRFTAAHEIGHLMLHLVAGKPAVLPRDTNFTGDAIEAQANGYAAGLLMPYELLQQYGPRYLWSESLLAPLFGVSAEAMRIRIQNFLAREYGHR